MKVKFTKLFGGGKWLLAIGLLYMNPYNQSFAFAAEKVSWDQQNVNTIGVIKDNDGQPLIGATILLKGSDVGTITDVDGKFSINAPENSVLVISYVGFLTKEIIIDGKFLEINLDPDPKLLDDVIVVGYGSQSKKNITGAISTVEGKDFENRPVFSTAQALQGKAAGVQVTQPSGKPGTEFSIRIRGTNSINANNDPLYVIHGIPTTDTKGLNPNDIESMQILKDAASASIYGARASNGVVLITTKKGKAGKTSTSFNTYMGFSQLANKIDVLNGAQYIQ